METLLKILSLDPGKESGTSQYIDGEFLSEQLSYPEVYFKLDKLITNNKYDHVVCENFFITAQTAKKSVGLAWSLRIIGLVDYLCLRENVEMTLQSPSDAKNFMTDKKLKEFGMWFPDKDQHCRDSFRHLGLFLFRNYPKEILK